MKTSLIFVDKFLNVTQEHKPAFLKIWARVGTTSLWNEKSKKQILATIFLGGGAGYFFMVGQFFNVVFLYFIFYFL